MQAWLLERKHLWWWVTDVTQLSQQAVLEAVLNHGRWQDFKDLQQFIGLQKMAELFVQMTRHKQRVNLRPEKQALFTHYFNRHVIAS